MARERAARAQVDVEFVEADMREIPMSGFTAVFLLYESFGFLDTDAEHLQVLESIRKSLVPGGHVLLQVDNRDHAVRQPPRQWGEYETLLWWEDNRFDPLTSRNHLSYTGLDRQTGTFLQQHIHYRLFSLHELRGLVEAARLDIVNCWGTLEGQPLAWDTSPSLILHARCPG
jgi:SAM-dependent methyltransferase